MHVAQASLEYSLQFLAAALVYQDIKAFLGFLVPKTSAGNCMLPILLHITLFRNSLAVLKAPDQAWMPEVNGHCVQICLQNVRSMYTEKVVETKLKPI